MTNSSCVLMVEDNEDDFEAAMRSFKRNHLSNPVQWCNSGQSAINYLKKEGDFADRKDVVRPLLIMLDLNMPGIDGRAVLKFVKQTPELCAIPIVILTTSNDPMDIERCYELGASTYIQKPVTFDGLTEAVRTMKDYWFNVAILPSAEAARA